MTRVFWRDDDNEDNLLHALEQVFDAHLLVTHIQVGANVANFLEDLRKYTSLRYITSGQPHLFVIISSCYSELVPNYDHTW